MLTTRELGWWIALAIGMLVLSAFFSAAEVAMFALRRVDREQLSRSGKRADAMVLALLGQPKRLVESLLIGDQAVTMMVAAIAAALFADGLPDLQPWAIAFLAAVAVAPLVMLVAEVLPRTLAIKTPIASARLLARPLWFFALVLTPVRLVVHWVAEVLAWPLGGSGRPRAAADLSEEEFRTLVDAGSAQGQVDARERRLIHRVFEFGDKNVGQVMTPRDKVFALNYDLPMARLTKEVAARGFSRVPIYQRSLDNVRGILNAKDLVLATTGKAPGRALSELLHEPLFVPRTTPVSRLFRTMKQKKVHMAVVVSEYGKLLGLVTMDDLLVQLFGAIQDERESLQRPDRRGRGGRTPLPGSLPATTVTAASGAAIMTTTAGASLVDVRRPDSRLGDPDDLGEPGERDAGEPADAREAGADDRDGDGRASDPVRDPDEEDRS
ncbi:MAG TPA: hemolysin family protein [Kofleriaceae bacterium]|nr:hemolysin family protein [Kofleriaceae bacterium]